MNIQAELRRRFASVGDTPPNRRPTGDDPSGRDAKKFGDYQANFVMPLAKVLNGITELAIEVISKVSDLEVRRPHSVRR
jgi:arginyl-tRNA synthetase